MNFDFQIMANGIVKCLRGAQTQMALSRKLGYKFNQVHRWETGITFPYWSDYIRVAKECRVDPTAQLHSSPGYQGEAEDLPRLLLFLASNRDISTIARLSRLSRFSLGHWLQGSSEPKLYKGLEKHDSKVLAESIHIPAHAIDKSLEDLKNIGFIKKTNGRWEVTDRKLQDGQPFGAGIDLYWAERVSKFFRHQSSASGGVRTAMVFNCSVESLAKIRQLFLRFSHKADAIIESDQNGQKRVALLQCSQIFLDELSEGVDPE